MSKRQVVFIAVSAEKMLEALQFRPNFIDAWPNLDLLALLGYKKKICLKFSVKVQKKELSL